MKVNDEGLKLIKVSEGLRLGAYKDAVGVWTIGYGHTSAAGDPRVMPGQKITKDQADQILKRDVYEFARGVANTVKVPLSDNQFSALVSFAYNVGLGALKKSSVLKAVNAGQFNKVPGALSLWVKADGQTLPGLVKRRAAEAALFMKDSPEGAEKPDKPRSPKQDAGAVVAGGAAVGGAAIAAQAADLNWQLIVAIGAGMALAVVVIYIFVKRRQQT
jgi:lysozyme